MSLYSVQQKGRSVGFKSTKYVLRSSIPALVSQPAGGASATAGGANAVSGTMETLVPPTALAPPAAALGPPLAAERKPPATEKARSLLVADPASPKTVSTHYLPIVKLCELLRQLRLGGKNRSWLSSSQFLTMGR